MTAAPPEYDVPDRRAPAIRVTRHFLPVFRAPLPAARAALAGKFARMPGETTWDDLQALALCIDGYRESRRLGLGDCSALREDREREYRSTGAWRGTAAELWCCLFIEQRKWHDSRGPSAEELVPVRALYRALRERLVAEAPALVRAEDDASG